jgi:hypothetical protein
MIYVADFDLPDNAVKSESPLAHLPLHAWREQSQAHALVETMEEALTLDLVKKGLHARRLTPGEAPPTRGWLVRGTIQRLDEGDRLRRAVVGFGSGQTDLRVEVSIESLSSALPPQPLYQVQTKAQSAKSPGAVVSMNPYAAAAKFAFTSHDLSRDAQRSASRIADQVDGYIISRGGAHSTASPAASTANRR